MGSLSGHGACLVVGVQGLRTKQLWWPTLGAFTAIAMTSAQHTGPAMLPLRDLHYSFECMFILLHVFQLLRCACRQGSKLVNHSVCTEPSRLYVRQERKLQIPRR